MYSYVMSTKCWVFSCYFCYVAESDILHPPHYGGQMHHLTCYKMCAFHHKL